MVYFASIVINLIQNLAISTMIPKKTNHSQGRFFEARLSEQLNPNMVFERKKDFNR